MHKRARVCGDTLRRVSEELAGLPVDSELADVHAGAIETLMNGVDQLRKLPLKDFSPPLVFFPEDDLT